MLLPSLHLWLLIQSLSGMESSLRTLGILELGVHAWLVSPRWQHICLPDLFLPCGISLSQMQGNWELLDSSREFKWFVAFPETSSANIVFYLFVSDESSALLFGCLIYGLWSFSLWLRLIELTVDTLGFSVLKIQIEIHRCLMASRISDSLDPWHSVGSHENADHLKHSWSKLKYARNINYISYFKEEKIQSLLLKLVLYLVTVY